MIVKLAPMVLGTTTPACTGTVSFARRPFAPPVFRCLIPTAVNYDLLGIAVFASEAQTRFPAAPGLLRCFASRNDESTFRAVSMRLV
jgi:hypothetical protein